MPNPYPLRPSIDHTPRSQAVHELEDDDAIDVIKALNSETARAIIQLLAEEPATTSELADHVGSSLQNVQYHLRKLQDAGLVTEAGTWYSARGKEMSVYAPMNECVELQLSSSASDPPDSERGETETSHEPLQPSP